jgi:2-dehydropantoate 2-reductase
MRVCIFGAGAVGGCLAGRLSQHDAAISVVARGATLAAIRENGITVHAPRSEMHARVTASDDPAALGPQDAVIVCVKSPALPQVAKAIGPLLHADTAVVFAMNGIPWWYHHGLDGPLADRRLPRIDPGDAVWNAVGPRRALGGVVYCACDVAAPGVVHVETANGRLILGEPDGTVSARAETLAALMRADDFTVKVSPDIRQVIWSKLQLNIATGLVGCLTDTPPKAVFGDPAIEAAVRALVAEVGTVAQVLGYATGVTGDQVVSLVRDQSHKSSIVQDLANGRPMEIDPTFATPLEMARATGVPTPTLELLVALVKAKARTVGAYPNEIFV